MHTYALDLRQRVAAACDEGSLSQVDIAELFQVSTAWIRRLLQRRRDSGSLQPRPHAGGHPPALDDHCCRRLAALVAETPDATLAELRDRLCVPVSLSTLCRTLARLGLPRKKVSGRQRARPARCPAPTGGVVPAGRGHRPAALRLP